MISYNFEELSFYKDNDKAMFRPFKLSVYDICKDFQIGKSYFVINNNHNLIEFKVIRMYFTNHSKYLEIVFADGTSTIDDAFMFAANPIFESIEQYQLYIKNNDICCLYNGTIHCVEFLKEYISNGLLTIADNDKLTPFAYELTRTNIPIQIIGEFDRLYVDADGLHYRCVNENAFPSKEDALNSVNIICF